MAPRLTVHNAQISTATIEIKTLTLTGKQVTLAVFRQLQEEELINWDGTLNGIAWGTVRYCPDKSSCVRREMGDHLHIVWQLGNELRRACHYANELGSRHDNRNDAAYAAWDLQWAALQDLPQLFIAV